MRIYNVFHLLFGLSLWNLSGDLLLCTSTIDLAMASSTLCLMSSTLAFLLSVLLTYSSVSMNFSSSTDNYKQIVNNPMSLVILSLPHNFIDSEERRVCLETQSEFAIHVNPLHI